MLSDIKLKTDVIKKRLHLKNLNEKNRQNYTFTLFFEQRIGFSIFSKVGVDPAFCPATT